MCGEIQFELQHEEQIAAIISSDVFSPWKCMTISLMNQITAIADHQADSAEKGVIYRHSNADKL